ncbi:MAG: hypothetical protein QM778_16235 [Myxococcales bacterium]
MLKKMLAPLFAMLALSACGDDDDGGSHGTAQANPQIHAYCEANCKKNDECGVKTLFEGGDCVTVCEGFTTAFGECKPSQAVTDACIKAIQANTCDAQMNDDEPEECDAICPE